MPSPKQSKYIRDLMVNAGHAHPEGYLRGSSKTIPLGPTMRQRSSGTVDEWIAGLTAKQASEVIQYLVEQRNR